MTIGDHLYCSACDGECHAYPVVSKGPKYVTIAVGLIANPVRGYRPDKRVFLRRELERYGKAEPLSSPHSGVMATSMETGEHILVARRGWGSRAEYHVEPIAGELVFVDVQPPRPDAPAVRFQCQKCGGTHSRHTHAQTLTCMCGGVMRAV